METLIEMSNKKRYLTQIFHLYFKILIEIILGYYATRSSIYQHRGYFREKYRKRRKGKDKRKRVRWGNNRGGRDGKEESDPDDEFRNHDAYNEYTPYKNNEGEESTEEEVSFEDEEEEEEEEEEEVEERLINNRKNKSITTRNSNLPSKINNNI